MEPKRRTGSRVADLTRHKLRTATSIDELLADEHGPVWARAGSMVA